jgi:uncharacterized membrane protein
MTTTPVAPASSDASGTRRWTDHQVDQVIGRLLQIGVAVATVVVLIGSALLLLRHGHDVVDLHQFRGTSERLRSVGSIAHYALSGDPLAIIQLGLVLLIATPLARVGLTLAAFVVQRDWLYTVLTGLVLAILIWGLLH